MPVCRRCGTESEPSSRFCPTCGTDFGGAQVFSGTPQGAQQSLSQTSPISPSGPTRGTYAMPVTPPKSGWKKWGAIGLSIVVAVIVIGVIASAASSPSYGVKVDQKKVLTFGKIELFYLDPVNSFEAQDLLDYMIEALEFSETSNDHKTFHLSKEGDTYELRIVIKKGLETEQETIDAMKFLAAIISQDVFGGASLDIHLCDDYLNTLRVVVV